MADALVADLFEIRSDQVKRVQTARRLKRCAYEEEFLPAT